MYIKLNFWKFSKEEEIKFLSKELMNLKKLVKEKFMKRFGAYVNNKLVGELGIFYYKDIGRFDAVLRIETIEI